MNKDAVTGNTGNARWDGTARGGISFLVFMALNVLAHFSGWLTNDDLVYLDGVIIGGAPVLWGIFDHVRKAAS